MNSVYRLPRSAGTWSRLGLLACLEMNAFTLRRRFVSGSCAPSPSGATRNGVGTWAGTLLILLFCCVVETSGQNQQLQSLIHEGQVALDAGDFPQAARKFEQARQLSPESEDAARGLMLAYLQQGRLQEAEATGQPAFTNWPKDAELAHYLGLVYFKEGKNAAALVALSRSSELNPRDYGTHFDTALVLLSDSKYPEAADELEKAIKLDPKAAMPHVLLGRAYQNTNR